MDTVVSNSISADGTNKGKGAPDTIGAPWTFVEAFNASAKSYPDALAFRAKERGIWRSWTYREAAEETGRLAAGLSQLGLSRGDRVAVIGPNAPRLYMCVIASQTIGAVPVIFHPDIASEELRNLAKVQDIRAVVSKDLASANVITSAIGSANRIAATVVVEKDDVQQASDGNCIAYDTVVADGSRIIIDQQNWLANASSRLVDTGPAFVSFTAGSEAPGHEVPLSHAMIRRAINVMAPLNAFGEGEDAFAFLPMSHYADQLQFFCAIAGGATLNTPESSLTVFSDMRDIRPSVLLATPTVYAKFRGLHEDRMQLASGIMKFLVSGAVRKAEQTAMGQRRSSALNLVALNLFLMPIRRQMGFGSVKHAISTQSQLPNYLRGFFKALGLRFTELYGAAECAGAIAISNGPSFTADNPALDIGEDGSLLVSIDHDAAAGLSEADEIASSSTAEFVLETGDIATRHDGQLTIAGRKDSQIRFNDGTFLQPEPIERGIADSPYIRAVVLVGQSREDLTAMIIPSIDRLTHWGKREGLSFTNDSELLADDKTRDLFRSLIAKPNTRLASSSDTWRISRFQIIQSGPAFISRHGCIRRKKLQELAADQRAAADVV